MSLNDEPDRPQLPGGRLAHVTRTRRTVGAIVLLSVVGFGIVLSLAVGSKAVPFGTVLQSFTTFDGSLTDHLIVRQLRLPRTELAVMVGAALGVAGALMQGVTRNPLADPGLLGVNAGASFAVVLAIWAFSITDVFGLVWFAFVGAAITSVLVYALGSMGRGGANPVRLALAGAALSALLAAFTAAVTLLDEATLDQYRFWAVGSLAGREAAITAQLFPFVAVGLLIAFGAGRQLNAWRSARRPHGRSAQDNTTGRCVAMALRCFVPLVLLRRSFAGRARPRRAAADAACGARDRRHSLLTAASKRCPRAWRLFTW